MILRRVVLLLCVLLLATPVMAQRLPAPKIGAIVIYEIERWEGIHGWCIVVIWERMPKAERGASGYKVAERYAVRQWKNGNKNKAPKLSHRKFYNQYGPIHSEWASVRILNSNAEPYWNDELFSVQLCGYDEEQEIKLRVRAIDKNGKYGKMSKVRRFKLPKFGYLGNPKLEGDVMTLSQYGLVYGDPDYYYRSRSGV